MAVCRVATTSMHVALESLQRPLLSSSLPLFLSPLTSSLPHPLSSPPSFLSHLLFSSFTFTHSHPPPSASIPPPLQPGLVVTFWQVYRGSHSKSKTFTSATTQRPSSLNNRGDDPTTLLFLHGFTSNKESWVRVTQNLPSTWRILVLDMPGHGESSFDPSSHGK